MLPGCTYKKIFKKYLDGDKSTVQKCLIREEKCLAINDSCEEAVGWTNRSTGGPGKTKGWQGPELYESREPYLGKQAQHEVKITKCQHCRASRGLWSNYRGGRSPGERSFYQLRNNNEARCSCKRTYGRAHGSRDPCLRTQKARQGNKTRPSKYRGMCACLIYTAKNATRVELTAYLTGPTANFDISPILTPWAWNWTLRLPTIYIPTNLKNLIENGL